jgi:hypothetical protein
MGTPWVMKAAKIAHKQLENSYHRSPCAPAIRFAIVRVLFCSARNESETTARRNRRGVDELSELMHNLASLLLTNKTIRKRSKAVPNTAL